MQFRRATILEKTLYKYVLQSIVLPRNYRSINYDEDDIIEYARSLLDIEETDHRLLVCQTRDCSGITLALEANITNISVAYRNSNKESSGIYIITILNTGKSIDVKANEKSHSSVFCRRDLFARGRRCTCSNIQKAYPKPDGGSPLISLKEMHTSSLICYREKPESAIEIRCRKEYKLPISNLSSAILQIFLLKKKSLFNELIESLDSMSKTTIQRLMQNKKNQKLVYNALLASCIIELNTLRIGNFDVSSDLWCKNKTHKRGQIKLNLHLYFKLDGNGDDDYDEENVPLQACESKQSISSKNMPNKKKKMTSECESDILSSTDCEAEIAKNELSNKLFVEWYFILFRAVVCKSILDDGGIWDGTIAKTARTLLNQFSFIYGIGRISQTLLEFLCLIDLYSTGSMRYCIDIDTISMALNQLIIEMEKNACSSSTCDLSRSLTDFEKSLYKENTMLFINVSLSKQKEQTWIPSNEGDVRAILKIIHIIECIIKVPFVDETSMMEKFGTSLVSVIQSDAHMFLKKKIHQIDDESVQGGLRCLQEALRIVNFACAQWHQNVKLKRQFQMLKINYSTIIINSIGDDMKMVIEHVADQSILFLSQNWREVDYIWETCSRICNLYQELDIYVGNSRNLNKEINTKTLSFCSVEMEYAVFMELLTYCITAYRLKAKKTIMNIVEFDLTHGVSKASETSLYGSSAVDVTSLLSGMCEDWNSFNIKSFPLRKAGMLQFSNIICESCTMYADLLLVRIHDYLKYKMTMTQMCELCCILVNNIIHISESIVKKVPVLVRLSAVLSEMKEDAQFFQSVKKEDIDHMIGTTRAAVKGMSRNARNFMNIKMLKLLFLFIDEFKIFYHRKVKELYDECPTKHQTRLESEKLPYILNEQLTIFKKCLDNGLFVVISKEIWSSLIHIMEYHLPNSREAAFYQQVRIELNHIHNIFSCNMMLNFSSTCYQNFHLKLLAYSTETTTLIQMYYSELAKRAHAKQQKKSAAIHFKMGLIKVAQSENSEDIVNLIIKVVCCTDLPKMDFIGLTDPYIVAELLPEKYFTVYGMRRTRIMKRNLNPVFDEIFIFESIPAKMIKDCVVRFAVYDYDCVGQNDFCGESFALISSASIIPNERSISFEGLRILPLRIQQEVNVPELRSRTFQSKRADLLLENNSIKEIIGASPDQASLRSSISKGQFNVFDLLEKRKSCDKEAKLFVDKRRKIMSGNTSAHSIAMVLKFTKVAKRTMSKLYRYLGTS